MEPGRPVKFLGNRIQKIQKFFSDGPNFLCAIIAKNIVDIFQGFGLIPALAIITYIKFFAGVHIEQKQVSFRH
jgi:hypothetical protein